MAAVVHSAKVGRLDWLFSKNGVKDMQKVAFSSLLINLIGDRFFRLLELVEDLLTLLFIFLWGRFDYIQNKRVFLGLSANLSDFVSSLFLFDLK
jgi:hypothetical protein